MADNHFERLGLTRRFDLDSAEIEQRYLARSRQVHPDAHQLGSSGEQLASLELSSALNEAYSTLRDPIRRAEYLLQLEGGPSASDTKEMPPAFLEEVLELRMEIEALKMQDSSSPAIAEMESRLESKYLSLMDEIARTWRRWPEVDDREATLHAIRERLNALKYVQGLQRDLHAD